MKAYQWLSGDRSLILLLFYVLERGEQGGKESKIKDPGEVLLLMLCGVETSFMCPYQCHGKVHTRY